LGIQAQTIQKPKMPLKYKFSFAFMNLRAPKILIASIR
jgi:hypothetical protein